MTSCGDVQPVRAHEDRTRDGFWITVQIATLLSFLAKPILAGQEPAGSQGRSMPQLADFLFVAACKVRQGQSFRQQLHYEMAEAEAGKQLRCDCEAESSIPGLSIRNG